MSKLTNITAGPGDEATWGPYTGHPGDPRCPDPYEPTDAELAEEVARMIDDSQDLFWDVIDERELHANIHAWYCKMNDLTLRKMNPTVRANDFQAYSIALFTAINDALEEQCAEQATETIREDISS